MITMSTQQYCLRWNNHQPNFISVFSSLLNSESLVDVTLSAEGRHLQAHKLVLSACSAYFQSLFTINPCQHPIVILKDVKFNDLKVIIDFMYYGEVNVSQDQLPYILKTAEMLKIKGLAEIPVEASMKQNNSDRPEVLTTDTGWGHNNDVKLRQSLSPSPCSLSPGSKRKRLRKSSTGSGSGSTERPCDDHSNNEVTLTSPLGVAIIKPDPMGFQTDSNNSQRKHHGEGEMTRGSSHESVESESPHQITLQVPQQELSVQHSVESSTPLDIPGSSTTSQQTVTDRILITTRAQFPQTLQQTTNPLIVGTKRGRFLMRQSRIKRELELVQNPESGLDPLTAHYLSVPHVRVERQVSDPLPTISSHSPPPGHLLTVPGTNILVKQHSHPLLPSQTCHSPPIQQAMVPQLQVYPQANDCERTSSPITENVQQDTPTIQLLSTRSKTEDSSSSSLSLRVKSEELKRSISSPSQTNTRSSHCPVVRPGPALGCNYCWNTVDTHGRILRRKTKYHCPECQTNLCIVPCFQEYHERHVAQTDPIALTTSVMRVFPKTTSM